MINRGENRRSVVVGVRLSESDFNALTMVAGNLGMTRVDYIRELTDNALLLSGAKQRTK